MAEHFMVEPTGAEPSAVAASLTEAVPIVAAAIGAAGAGTRSEPLRPALLLSVRQPQGRTTIVHGAGIIRIRLAN
jgi:hypothetical protein